MSITDGPKKFAENPTVATEIKKNGTEHFGFDQDGVQKQVSAEILLTPANVGLGNIENKTINNQTPTFTIAASLAALTSGETLTLAFGKLAKGITKIIEQLDGKSAYRGTLIASDGSLDDITKTGFYTCYSSSTNVPSATESYFIIHMNSNVGVVAACQIAIGATTGKMYFRLKIDSTFGAWSTGITPTEWGYLSGTSSNIQEQLNLKSNKADIVDNLTSDDATKVLSAKQGKILDENRQTNADNIVLKVD